MASAPPLLPQVEALPGLPADKRAGVLDLLFEPCLQLHTLSVELLRTQRHSSYADLIASVGSQLTKLAESTSTSDTEWLDSILSSHPRLGERKVESVQSQAEQAHMKASSEEESEKLAALNIQYEQMFPGLRYVVFVNGRSRSTIMENMHSRIDRDNIELERHEAIRAMCEIALDRASKLSTSYNASSSGKT